MSDTERVDGSEEDFDTWSGYVRWIEVSQVGERDTLYFSLIDTDNQTQNFYTYLDSGTTVALAQLQLLRDAFASNWYVTVGYMATDALSGNYPVYSVRIKEPSSMRAPGNS